MRISAQYQGDSGGPKLFARRAEAAGFDAVFCGDHVAHLGDGLATLALMAGATDTITVGLNLLVTPYRPAAVIAKALATIALAAPGRVIAGFGVGGEFPGEFQATNAEVRSRGARTDESLEVITALWTGQPLTHHGRFFDLDDFTLEPPPRPAPEIWIGGRSEAALRRTIRYGTTYSPYLVSPDQLAKRAARLGELAAAAGVARPRLAALLTFIPGPDVDTAVQLGLSSFKLSGMSPDSVKAHYLLGDDRDILDRAAQYAAVGLDELILGALPASPGVVEDYFSTSTRLLAPLRALGATS
ncbi:MAG: LLM class flavin-dependent oxidoreductase [Acidimicrobiales bacterium]